jgi:hypothetical protein
MSHFDGKSVGGAEMSIEKDPLMHGVEVALLSPVNLGEPDDGVCPLGGSSQ